MAKCRRTYHLKSDTYRDIRIQKVQIPSFGYTLSFYKLANWIQYKAQGWISIDRFKTHEPSY